MPTQEGQVSTEVSVRPPATQMPVFGETVGNFLRVWVKCAPCCLTGTDSYIDPRVFHLPLLMTVAIKLSFSLHTEHTDQLGPFSCEVPHPEAELPWPDNVGLCVRDGAWSPSQQSFGLFVFTPSSIFSCKGRQLSRTALAVHQATCFSLLCPGDG